MPGFQTQGLCLSGFRHDVRLMRQLNAFELRHFLILLDYAGDRRDPTFIPARKREEVRLILGFGSGEGRERLEKRLRRWHDLELIQLGDDGSILLSYLLDQFDAEDEEGSHAPSGAYTAHPYANPYPNGSNGSNGNGASGNGSGGSRSPEAAADDRRLGPERRQPNRAYSMAPDAVRQRERRRLQAEASGEGGRRDISQNVTENVTLPESKRHAMDATLGLQMSQGDVTGNVAESRDIPRDTLARASDVLTSSPKEDNNIIFSPEDVQNVSDIRMSQNVTPQNVPQNVPPALFDRPPPRPGFEKLDLDVQCQKDVDAVMAITKDFAYRRSWPKVWRHCQAHDALDCWDGGVEALLARIARAPLASQEGHLPPAAYGASLRTTMQNMLRDRGCPMEQGTPEERAAAQEQIRASLLTSSSGDGDATAPAVGGAEASAPPGVTPLDDIYTEEGA